MKQKILLVLSFLAICQIPVSARGLSKQKAEKVRTQVIEKWQQSERTRLDYVSQDTAINVQGLTMPLHWKIFGEEPADGRALFISLHGGGHVESEVNDSQWRNQWRLYRPTEGVYLCPRAPYDDWDMHCKPLLDVFYRDVINYCVTHLNVNPDKVYILGYSAGGDGVWRMAPRMADTWAAASMMAGHPGDVRLENLLHTPFMIWCGALDDAYDRNKLDAERILQMDSLARTVPGGYIHEGHIVEGMPHWMNRVDTAAIKWMEQYRRDPYPRQIIWRQEAVLRPTFYWLSVPKDEMKWGKEIRISIQPRNIIQIQKCDYSHLTLNLNDQLVDLDQPVTVMMGNKELFKGLVPRTRKNMEATITESQDQCYCFPARIELTL